VVEEVQQEGCVASSADCCLTAVLVRFYYQHVLDLARRHDKSST
jgi:hypothetical protein